MGIDVAVAGSDSKRWRYMPNDNSTFEDGTIRIELRGWG
jgi:hypothetical protein